MFIYNKLKLKQKKRMNVNDFKLIFILFFSQILFITSYY